MSSRYFAHFLEELASGQGSFTVNAVLLKEQSGSFTADSYLVKTFENSFVADSFFRVVNQATFTANAAIKKTISATKTASAVIKKSDNARTFDAQAEIVGIGQHLFGANAILVNKLIQDDFNRSTGSNQVGQPSVIGHYAEYDDSSSTASYTVNGSYFSVPADEYGAFKIGPTGDRLQFQFDFLISDDSGQYELPGGIYLLGDFATSDWILDAYPNIYDDYTFTPVQGDWWTIKVFLNSYGSQQQAAAKVWKRGDPEPDWQIAANNIAEGDYTQRVREDWLYAYGGQTNPAGIDNLIVNSLGGTTVDFFTADAFLSGGGGTFTASATLRRIVESQITADSVLTTILPLESSFTADSFLLRRFQKLFFAEAEIVFVRTGAFSVNSYLIRKSALSFYANAIIRSASVAEPGVGLRKIQTLHVEQRRPIVLSAFVPPRETEGKDKDKDGGTGLDGDGGCLPPCPGANGPYGANGGAIRRTVFYCSNCNDLVYSERNMLGRDAGTGTHVCCTGSHSLGDHTYRIWVQYDALPVEEFEMRARLKWEIDDNPSEPIRLKVFGNVSGLPAINQNDCIPFDAGTWNEGEFLGEMRFYTTGGGAVVGGPEYRWDETPAVLLMNPDTLFSNTFRFELVDESTVVRAEFKAANIKIVA